MNTTQNVKDRTISKGTPFKKWNIQFTTVPLNLVQFNNDEDIVIFYQKVLNFAHFAQIVLSNEKKNFSWTTADISFILTQPNI